MTRRELLSRVVHAREALDDGDIEKAGQLLGSLEAEVRMQASLHCSECGLNFEWPGLLDHHLRLVHGKEVA